MTFLLRFWKPLAAVALLALLFIWLQHVRSEAFTRGYQQAVSENARALDAWKLTYDRTVRDNADRLRKAEDQHTAELAKLAALASQPRPRLVCHRTDRTGAVPATPGLPEPGSADSGLLSRAGAEGFDPVPELFDLAAEADYILANCRQLNQAVHGVPSR